MNCAVSQLISDSRRMPTLTPDTTEMVASAVMDQMMIACEVLLMPMLGFRRLRPAASKRMLRAEHIAAERRMPLCRCLMQPHVSTSASFEQFAALLTNATPDRSYDAAVTAGSAPALSWMTPRPSEVQTPKRVVATEMVSMKSPIQPKILSPMTGWKADFIVIGRSLQKRRTSVNPHAGHATSQRAKRASATTLRASGHTWLQRHALLIKYRNRH